MEVCVLGTGRSLRRLTACDVVVGTSCIMQRRWFARQLLGSCAVLYFFSTRRGTRILRSSLSALWCVGLRVTLDGECAQSILQLPSEPVVALGIWTLRSLAPCIWQFLFAVWVYSSWRNAWFNSG